MKFMNSFGSNRQNYNNEIEEWKINKRVQHHWHERLVMAKARRASFAMRMADSTSVMPFSRMLSSFYLQQPEIKKQPQILKWHFDSLWYMDCFSAGRTRNRPRLELMECKITWLAFQPNAICNGAKRLSRIDDTHNVFLEFPFWAIRTISLLIYFLVNRQPEKKRNINYENVED